MSSSVEKFIFRHSWCLVDSYWGEMVLDKIRTDDYYMTLNGKKVEHINICQDTNNGNQNGVYRVNFRLVGGKGGFGSMLRAIGAQIEKTTNREACRDLSGRRMRDVNNEKKIGDWLKKQADKEEERKQKRQEKLERLLNPPKHVMDNRDYVHTIQDNAHEMNKALQKGLTQNVPRKIETSTKRKGETVVYPAKKAKTWYGVDMSSDEDSDGCLDPENHVSPVEKCMPDSVAMSNGAVPSSSDNVSINDDKNEFVTQPETLCTDFSSFDQDRTLKEQEPRKVTEQKIKQSLDGGPANSCEESSSSGEFGLQQNVAETGPIDLNKYDSIEELESLGLERLKQGLISLGLKCGGTLTQRAERLFLLKSMPLDQLDKSLFAKAGKGKKK